MVEFLAHYNLNPEDFNESDIEYQEIMDARNRKEKNYKVRNIGIETAQEEKEQI